MLKCPICERKIQNEQALKVHMKWKHPEQEKEASKQQLTVEDNQPEKATVTEDGWLWEEYSCGECEAELQGDDVFCRKCGKELDWYQVEGKEEKEQNEKTENKKDN